MLWTAPDGWVNLGGGIICSTIRKSLVKNAISPEEEKRSKKNPTIRCCEQHMMVRVILWGGHNL